MTPPGAPPSVPTDLLEDRFHVGPQLRVAPDGDVYLAHDHQLYRDVSLTILRDELTANEAAVALFAARAAAGGGLFHRSIARTLDTGYAHWNSRPAHWIATDPDAGIPVALYQRPREVGAADWADSVAALAAELADAMAYAHTTGTIHGNLGPGTVLLGQSAGPGRPPRATIVDFGPHESTLPGTELSRQVWERFTARHSYSAPERRSHVIPTQPMDIYGFGYIIGNLLFRLPLLTATADDPDRDRTATMIQTLRALSATAMHADPDRRPASFDDIREDLRELHTLTRHGVEDGAG